MAEKKYKGRKAYLNDFHKNEKGDYEYQGILYEWKGEEGTLCREMILLVGIGVVMLAALILAGCVDAPGAINCFYVVLPYTVSFIAGISMVWGMWRLLEGGNPLREYVYKASVEQIPIRAIFTIIGAGAAIVGEIVYLIGHGFQGKSVKSMEFLLLESVVFVLAVILRKRVMVMPWKRQ
ncbi:MAG: hypothetical protein IJ024_00055 [Lachnospiraceae bacterium]|nr:hypothetical protein [Lachnospiraceae bacterium]